jgi:hypothetical protein
MTEGKKRSLVNMTLLFMSLLISVGLAEIALRLIVPAPQTYEDIISSLVEHPERLFKRNTSVLYDIKGLYEGANTAELNISRERLIEPQPRGVHRHHVLFLGGSTTEAIYVPQPQRWVALLNEPAVLAAYNAGQSGANTIDEYFTFLYLIAQGMKFDLVVLATGQNDMGWLQHFDKHGNRFVIEEYNKGIHDYYIDEIASKPSSFEAPRARSAVYRLASEAFENVRQFLNMKSRLVSPKNVTKIYLDMRKAALTTFTDDRRPPDMRLMDRYDHLESLTQKYRENVAHNIGLLNEAVSRTGAKLLVITEATSWMAPTSSFYQDLRVPSGMSSYEDLHEYRLLLNGIYLQAAKQAGALTYDLAADVNPHSNGPRGGRYMYDNMHYTPEGCRLAASFMRPVLHRLLEAGGPR